MKEKDKIKRIYEAAKSSYQEQEKKQKKIILENTRTIQVQNKKLKEISRDVDSKSVEYDELFAKCLRIEEKIKAETIKLQIEQENTKNQLQELNIKRKELREMAKKDAELAEADEKRLIKLENDTNDSIEQNEKILSDIKRREKKLQEGTEAQKRKKAEFDALVDAFDEKEDLFEINKDRILLKEAESIERLRKAIELENKYNKREQALAKKKENLDRIENKQKDKYLDLEYKELAYLDRLDKFNKMVEINKLKGKV